MIRTGHAVEVRRVVPAAPYQVFDALGSAEALVNWFSPRPEIAVTVLDFDFRPGGTYRFGFRYPDGREMAVHGAYRAIRPPDELVFSWIWEAPDPHAGLETEVSIRLVAHDLGTQVVVCHTQLPDRAATDRYDTGWTAQLQRLEIFFTGSFKKTERKRP